jgi:hypothetical protein
MRRCVPRTGTVAALLVLALGTTVQASFPYHTFDADNQGGLFAGGPGDGSGGPTSAGGPGAGWDTRGNPGGALSAPDVYSQTFVAAPGAFLGNQSDMYGKSFTYDILIRSTDNADYCPASITGAGLNLAYFAVRPPLGVWETRTVTFDESLWRVNTMSGAVATPAQLQSVLSDLTGVYLCTEWRTGGDDTSIDNVGVVPEPATLSLLAFGAMAALRRRQYPRRCRAAR